MSLKRQMEIHNIFPIDNYKILQINQTFTSISSQCWTFPLLLEGKKNQFLRFQVVKQWVFMSFQRLGENKQGEVDAQSAHG